MTEHPTAEHSVSVRRSARGLARVALVCWALGGWALGGWALAAPRPQPRPPPPAPGAVEPEDPTALPALVRDLHADRPGDARYAARELARQARSAARAADRPQGGDRALEAQVALAELEAAALVPCIQALAQPTTAQSCAEVLVVLQNPAGLAPLEAAAQQHSGRLARKLALAAEALRTAQEAP